ncbi:hypothetical protein [Paracoccus yeei]|uniref:hypothetical protein n=1 Tax=Paracoccus yeei TaxID=147645 RepID=UPI003BF7B14C
MASMKPGGTKFGRDIDNDLLEWGSRPEREVIPDRLRELAMQLREALIKARSNDRPPAGD